MPVLAISPHLDDAVLSAGATLWQLAQSGISVTVFTVFAGSPAEPYSPAARKLHKLWAIEEDPVRIRRLEDQAALRLLGCTPWHGDLLDAIYRRRMDGEWLLDDNCWPSECSDADEPDLEYAVAAAIAGVLAQTKPDLVLSCAALGDHVDHRRVRDVLLRQIDPTSTPVHLWEDIPYSLGTAPLPDLPIAARHQPCPVQVSADKAWLAKYAAIECYESQQAMLWSGSNFRAELDKHSASRSHGTGNHAHGEKRSELFWTCGAETNSPIA